MIIKDILLKLRKLTLVLGMIIIILSIPNITGFSQDSTNSEVFLPLIQKSPQIICDTQLQTQSILPSYILKLSTIEVSSSDFFVSTNGKTNGDGSMNNPWDLDSALLKDSSKVKPGDVIWVRGGTYRPVKEPSKFNIKVSGSDTNPVVIRAYPGERVTIDAGIQIHEPNVVFWGFEVFSSSTHRISDDRPGGIEIYSDNVGLINNIIHDGESGISAQVSIGKYYSRNSIIYGNLSYNNGWIGDDRGHGHGLYGQNESGTKYIFENIIFNNFGGYSYHIYGENVPLNNFLFFGNVALNDNFLVGGLTPATNVGIYENFTFNAKTKLGFSNAANEDISVEGNHFWNDETSALEIKWWQRGAKILNNCLYSKSTVSFLDRVRENYTWDLNSYFSTNSRPFTLDNSNINWGTWKARTNFDMKSSFSSNIPNKTNIIVRPNYFEEKRGNIIVQNWQKLDSVSVDISSLGLGIGDQYTIHNAQNYFNETIQGTYNGGLITIPMKGWSVAKPIGWSETLGDNTFPSFGVFVLTTKP